MRSPVTVARSQGNSILPTPAWRLGRRRFPATVAGMEGEAEIASLALGMAPAGRLASPIALLRKALEAERDRWFLWLPLFLGSGIGLYFTLTDEPPLWLGLVVAPLAVAAALFARRFQRFTLPAIAIAAVAGGFAAGEIETWMAAAPVLERRVGPVPVEGRVM